MYFRLVRYVTLTSLVFFVLAGGALGYFYREMALTDMLRLQESGNANLTRVFANNLWQTDFFPLLAETASTAAPELKKNSRLQEIHNRVVALMRGSTTYKIKVYDTRGRTVYSSEPAQIGEDKSGNPGFLGALAGETKTELVHKEKFSAFEQVVENRDLIQSYIPQHDPITRQTTGVFEIYSDVTPFLAEIRETEKQLFVAVAAAFGTLYLALFFIVRHAERVIKRQTEEREVAQQQLAHSEKMASLGQLVAGVAHQLNTPIAFSHNNVSLAIQALKDFELPLKLVSRLADLVRRNPGAEHVTLRLGNNRAVLAEIEASERDAATVSQMLGDVLQGMAQMRELVENLRDFTRLDRSKVVNADLNAALHTVLYIARSAIPTRIRIVEDFSPLPPVECNPSQLNQIFLNLITNAAQAIPGDGQVVVRSSVAGATIRIDVSDNGTGIPDDVLPHIFDSYFTTKPEGVGTGLGLSIAREVARNHGGDINVVTQAGVGTTFTITLPLEARRETQSPN